MAFDTLKATFILAPILVYFNPDQDVIVKTDVSNYVSFIRSLKCILKGNNISGIIHIIGMDNLDFLL
jgi:hypothetical protein